MSASASTARIVGLLILGILFLVGIGLFGVEFTHEEGDRALREAVASSTRLDDARTAQVAFKIQVQDWKNFLIRGHDATDYAKYVAEFGKAESAVDKSLGALESGLPAGKLRDEVAAIRSEHARLGAAYRDAMKGYERGKLESTFAVDASVRGIDQKLTQRIDAVAQEILASEHARVSALTESFERRHGTLRNLMIGATIFVFGLLALVVWRRRGAAR
jgi:methyl-accepting chemotaxis protein-1 (serine sensor receptor)